MKILKNKKFIIPIIIFIVVAVGAGITYNKERNKPVGTSVEVGAVEHKDLREIVKVKGVIEGSEKATLQSNYAAEVRVIYVKEGDKVSKGQLLAKLDSSDIAKQAEKSRLALAEAKRKYDDARVLYEAGALTANEYMDSKAAYEMEKSNLSSFDFDKVNIKSPIAGTVTRVNITVGSSSSNTGSSEPMFIIENLEDLQLKVKVSEYDISKIKIGQSVDIRAEVIGKEVAKGVISNIAPSGEKKDQFDSSVKEMVIPVSINVESKDSGLIAGVNARAEIEIASKKNVMAVPVDTIGEDVDDGSLYVFVAEGGKAKKVMVEAGIAGDFYTEVISKDLKEGDRLIVLSSDTDIEDGMDVIVPEDEEDSKDGKKGE